MKWSSIVSLCASLVTLLCTLSCGSGAGSFTLSITWDSPPEDEVWLWVRVEERTDPTESGAILASAGPEGYDYGDPVSLSLEKVTNGDNRYVVVEVRDGPNTGLPIVYYGISKPFTLAPGADVEVEVPMTMQAPETQATEATVQLRFSGEIRDQVGPAEIVDATIVTRSVNAGAIFLANDASFSANAIQHSLDDREAIACTTEVEGEVIWDVCEIAGWDLTAGLAEEPTDEQLTVFVKFLDRYGYESPVYRASVVLDSQGPLLLMGSLNPPISYPGRQVLLNMTFHEALAEEDGSGELSVKPTFPTGTAVEGPVRVGNSTTYLWTITLASEWGDDESYAFTVGTRDFLGNETAGQSVVDQDGAPLQLTIDAAPPLLIGEASTVPAPSLFGLPDAGEILSFQFVVEEVHPHDMLSGEFGCEGVCPSVRLGTAPLGTVFRAPELDVAETHRLGFRYEYVVDPLDFAKADSEVSATVSWSDQAGNPLEEIVDGAVHFDFQPPAAECSLIPSPPAGGYAIGQKVLLQISPLEELAAGFLPMLTEDFEPGLEGAFLGYDETTKYRFSRVIQEGDGERTFSIAVSLTDLAGNATAEGETACLEGSVTGAFDGTAPTVAVTAIDVADSELDPLLTPLKTGLTVAAAVTVTNCANLPEVSLGQGPMAAGTVEPVSSGDDQYQWVFERELDGSEGEGWRDLAVAALDAAGNSAYHVEEHVALLDFTAPTAQCTANPPSAAQGDLLMVTVSAAEPLDGDLPDFQSTPSMSVPEPDDGATSFTYTHKVGADDGALTDWSYVVHLTDLVGNATAAGEDACSAPVSAAFDTVPPAIMGGTEGILVSEKRVAEHVTFELFFTVEGEEEIADLVATVGGRAMEKSDEPPTEDYTHRYTYTPNAEKKPPDEEGVWPLSVTLIDGAGNETSYSPGTVLFDFSAPQLSGTTGMQLIKPGGCPLQSISALGRGGALEVTFALNEVLEIIPAVWFEGTGTEEPLFFSPVGAAEPDQFAYTYRLGEVESFALIDGLKGDGQVMLSATDLAGNGAQLTLLEALPVDTEWREPPPRHRAPMTYDSLRGRVVLYGGYGIEGARVGQTSQQGRAVWRQEREDQSAAPARHVRLGRRLMAQAQCRDRCRNSASSRRAGVVSHRRGGALPGLRQGRHLRRDLRNLGVRFVRLAPTGS